MIVVVIERIVFAHLSGSIDLIRSRLAGRKHRTMPASLLESQFATLEPPRHAIEVDIALPPEDCVAAIVSALRHADAAAGRDGRS